MRKIKVALGILLGIFVSSCTDYSNQIYVDEGRKAIIPCNGGILKDVEVETPDTDVRYEGADTIFFNKINSAKITVFDQTNNNYRLKLKPNSTYEIWSYSSNGDQGPYRIILKTDNKSNIIHDDENNCR